MHTHMHKYHSAMPTYPAYSFSYYSTSASHRIAGMQTDTHSHSHHYVPRILDPHPTPIFVSRTSCVSPAARLPCRTPLVLTFFEFGVSIIHQIGTYQVGRLAGCAGMVGVKRQRVCINMVAFLPWWVSNAKAIDRSTFHWNARPRSYCSSRALSDSKTHQGYVWNLNLLVPRVGSIVELPS